MEVDKTNNLKDIMLLQPKSITFGQFDITPIQDNILTLIVEKLQRYLTNNDNIWTDLCGLPYILINCDEAGGLRNKRNVLEAARDLMSGKLFRYTWTNPRNGMKYDKTGTILCNADDESGTNKIVLTINPWATPYLLYYGKGVGGGYFSKHVVLNLRSEYAKRLYKMISSEADKREYRFNIADFKKKFLLPEKYTSNDIRRRVLDPAVKQIKESGSSVWCNYDLVTCKKENKHENSGHKTKADTIILHIVSTKDIGGTSQKERNDYVYHWLFDTFAPAGQDGLKKAEQVERILLLSPLLDTFYNRLKFWEAQVNTGKKTNSHVYNCIKVFIREELKVEC